MKHLNPDPRERKLPQEQYRELDGFIDSFAFNEEDPRRKEFVIQALHKAQHIFGYLPEEVQLHIADKFAVHHAEISGVISFYNYFTTEPKGKYQINVCMGTACYVRGADKVLAEFERVLGIKSGQVTEDQNFSIESLRCVGACGLAPVVTINGKVYGKVTAQQVREIVETYLEREEEEK